MQTCSILVQDTWSRNTYQTFHALLFDPTDDLPTRVCYLHAKVFGYCVNISTLSSFLAVAFACIFIWVTLVLFSDTSNQFQSIELKIRWLRFIGRWKEASQLQTDCSSAQAAHWTRVSARGPNLRDVANFMSWQFRTFFIKVSGREKLWGKDRSRCCHIWTINDTRFPQGRPTERPLWQGQQASSFDGAGQMSNQLSFACS